MDEIDKSNRHDVMVPSHIRKRHPALRFLHIFQRWIKPILAEFVATFILIFWACMLQPTVSLRAVILLVVKRNVFSRMQNHIFRINSSQLFQLDLHWLLSSLCFGIFVLFSSIQVQSNSHHSQTVLIYSMIALL